MWEEALGELKKLRKPGEQNAYLADEEAAIYGRLGRYERVLDLSKHDPKGRMAATAAVAMAHMGRREEALRAAQTAVKERRPNGEFATARVLEITGDLESALAWYERAAKRFGQRAEAMRRAASVLVELGDYREACVAWEQAIRLSPFVRAEDLERLAECRRKRGQSDRAREAEALAAEYRARDDAKAEEIAMLTAAKQSDPPASEHPKKAGKKTVQPARTLRSV